jgi:tRNA G26 N,N-dimethylase Trm1
MNLGKKAASSRRTPRCLRHWRSWLYRFHADQLGHQGRSASQEQLARTARHCEWRVRVFSGPLWSGQIRARGSEGILTRSIPQSGTGDQTAAFLLFVGAPARVLVVA